MQQILELTYCTINQFQLMCLRITSNNSSVVLPNEIFAIIWHWCCWYRRNKLILRRSWRRRVNSSQLLLPVRADQCSSIHTASPREIIVTLPLSVALFLNSFIVHMHLASYAERIGLTTRSDNKDIYNIFVNINWWIVQWTAFWEWMYVLYLRRYWYSMWQRIQILKFHKFVSLN